MQSEQQKYGNYDICENIIVTDGDFYIPELKGSDISENVKKNHICIAYV